MFQSLVTQPVVACAWIPVGKDGFCRHATTDRDRPTDRSTDRPRSHLLPSARAPRLVVYEHVVTGIPRSQVFYLQEEDDVRPVI